MKQGHPTYDTTTLRDGTAVLGKTERGRVWAKTYANNMQAQRAAESVNGEVMQRGRVFYVRVGM